jgi:dynein heavy chain
MVHREINDSFISLVKHFPRKKIKFNVFRCFIDDMNMPEMDKYYTVQAHTILRQYLDYKHWYDRQKLTLRDIHNCQYVACMNPTAGNFTIDSRIQRHFAVFAVSFPGVEALETIYVGILSQHLAEGFGQQVQKYTSSLVRGALELHRRITASFLPTAIKFIYMNLNVFIVIN